jgi:hypothetical protein
MKNSKEILTRTLEELGSKLLESQRQSDEYEDAIFKVKTLIGSFENDQQSTSPKVKSKRKSARVKRITENMVRDAIIELVKNPYPTPDRSETGFFSRQHIGKILEINPTNATISIILEKFESKGILESKPYKSGKQYRYIPPAQTGPGAASNTTIESSAESTAKRESIPGINNGNIHIRDKDVEKMVREAKRQGFIVEHRGSDHIRVANPKNNKGTTISATSNRSRHPTRVRASLVDIGVSL